MRTFYKLPPQVRLVFKRLWSIPKFGVPTTISVSETRDIANKHENWKRPINSTDRRKFRSQTSDNMDRWKAELGRGREKRRVEESRSEKRKSQKKEDAGRKVAKHCVFPMICDSGGSKSRLAKAAGAEPSDQMRDEKVHAVVARSTFVSEKAKKNSRSDHFWKLRCRKSARRCGVKHISKSKCTKHHMFAPLLKFRCRVAWQAQGIVHLLKSERNVRVL